MGRRPVMPPRGAAFVCPTRSTGETKQPIRYWFPTTEFLRQADRPRPRGVRDQRFPTPPDVAFATQALEWIASPLLTLGLIGRQREESTVSASMKLGMRRTALQSKMRELSITLHS